MADTIIYSVVSTASGLIFVIASRLIDKYLPDPGHKAAEDATAAQAARIEAQERLPPLP